MKTNSADIVKSIRKEMGLSQDEMAAQLFISVRQLARIESGEAGMDVWQFITMMELLSVPSEDFWLLYLDSGEYSAYREYKRLKRRVFYDDPTGSKAVIDAMENSMIIQHPLVKQYVSHWKTYNNATMPPEEKMAALLDDMRMSKPHFEEQKVSEYRRSYNEISIALCIAECLEAMGECDRAIAMLQAMIETRESARASEEDIANIITSLYFVLSRILRTAGRHKEALSACYYALETSRNYNNYRHIPQMLYCMADCYYWLKEEKHVYKTHLVRAYHAAYAMGRNEIAVKIKEDALRNYGVVIP